jgi:hypothetical protein
MYLNVGNAYINDSKVMMFATAGTRVANLKATPMLQMFNEKCLLQRILR